MPPRGTQEERQYLFLQHSLRANSQGVALPMRRCSKFRDAPLTSTPGGGDNWKWAVLTGAGSVTIASIPMVPSPLSAGEESLGKPARRRGNALCSP